MAYPVTKLIVTWVALAVLYLACVGSVTVVEAVAALLCGGLGLMWVHRILCCGEASLSLDARGLRPLLAAFARLPSVTVRVCARLVRTATGRDASGEIRAASPEETAGCPFREGAQAAGRRAVSVIATSLSPDSYVVRLDQERGRILVHALLPGKQPG